MEYYRQGHCIYYTRYHLVISTKYRRKILKGGIGKYLIIKILEINKHHPEINILEVNTDLEHIHLLLSIAPKMSLSDAVRTIKANTARDMRKKFKFLDKVYHGTDGIWSIGYFISSSGVVNEEIIRKYIKQQGLEDSGQAKLEI